MALRSIWISLEGFLGGSGVALGDFRSLMVGPGSLSEDLGSHLKGSWGPGSLGGDRGEPRRIPAHT